MQAMTDRTHVSADVEVAHASTFHSERVWLFVSEKSRKRPRQLRSEDSQEVGALKYRLDGVVAKERWSLTIIESLRGLLLSARSDADKYFQRLLLFTERFTADVVNSFSGFLYNLSTEVKK